MKVERPHNLPISISDTTQQVSYKSARQVPHRSTQQAPLRSTRQIPQKPVTETLMQGKEKSEVLRFQIRSKDVLAPDEMELFELTQLAGVTMDPSVFKILLDLLKMNVAPTAILQMLKLMCDPVQQRVGVADMHSFLSTSSDSLSLHSQRSARQRTAAKPRQGPNSSRHRDSRH